MLVLLQGAAAKCVPGARMLVSLQGAARAVCALEIGCCCRWRALQSAARCLWQCALGSLRVGGAARIYLTAAGVFRRLSRDTMYNII